MYGTESYGTTLAIPKGDLIWHFPEGSNGTLPIVPMSNIVAAHPTNSKSL